MQLLRTWRSSLQVVNDYEKDIFNGDQGFVTRITSGGSPSMEVTFPPSSSTAASAASPAAPERVIQYSSREMDVLDLAWATTVHKAQGGEAKAVLLALSPTHRPLLSRRLLYTGDPHCAACARCICIGCAALALISVVLGWNRALEQGGAVS